MGARVRIALAVVLAALAVAAVLLAGDVRDVRSALDNGDKAYAATPSRATWESNHAVQSLLGARDDVELRTALQRYVNASKLHLRLDNALEVESARASAQDALDRVSRSKDPRIASQALTLLGVLVFQTAASGGGPSQADTARADFTDAIRRDPDNLEAKYNLELLTRLTAAHGSRVESGQGGGFGRTGRRGAGAGQAGSGY
jgi:hypothetical protein